MMKQLCRTAPSTIHEYFDEAQRVTETCVYLSTLVSRLTISKQSALSLSLSPLI